MSGKNKRNVIPSMHIDMQIRMSQNQPLRAIRALTSTTHYLTADADCRLDRKGRGGEGRLSQKGHASMKDRHGLVVGQLPSRPPAQRSG